jgi:TRAP-type C4-dicarboxylate transport system permease small subunit
MTALHRVVYAIARAGAIAGGGMLLLAAVLVALDITLRTLFARTIGGADELSGYALAIATAWGMSFTLLQRAHIRIDSLYELCPRWLRAGLDLLSLLGMLAFMALVAWHGWGVLAQSVASSTRSISALGTPLAIPQALWLGGLVFLLLVVVVLLIEGAVALARRDLGRLFGLIGSRALQDELRDEIEAADRERDGTGHRA